MLFDKVLGDRAPFTCGMLAFEALAMSSMSLTKRCVRRYLLSPFHSTPRLPNSFSSSYAIAYEFS